MPSTLKDILKTYNDQYTSEDLLALFVLTGGVAKYVEMLMEGGDYTHISSWWDRKGENEIDIIACDELSKTLDVFEVKRQAKDIDLEVLKEKTLRFLQATGQCPDYEITYHGLSLDDMGKS